MTASAGKTLHNSKHQFFQRAKPLWNAGCYLFKNSHLRTFLFLIGVKKILQEVISPKNVLHCFSTEKLSALLVCDEKKIFPLRNLPTTIPPRMSNDSPLSHIWDLHFFNRKKKSHTKSDHRINCHNEGRLSFLRKNPNVFWARWFGSKFAR